MSERKVYPVGYSMEGSCQYVEDLMAHPQMLLIDTRFSPNSRSAEWRASALRRKYGLRYRLAGAYLGNVNYQGGPIALADPEEGIRGLKMYLDEGHDLVLLCQCPNYHSCHRRVIVESLVKQTSVEIVQPGPVRGDEAVMSLSIQQPYAHWLSNPGQFVQAGIRPKVVENRNWATMYRGPLLIHASITFDHGAINSWIGRCPELEQVIPLDRQAYAKGALVGIAELIDVVRQSDDPWFVGPYGFLLANARPLEPLPYRGQLKLFPVPIALVHTHL